MPYKKGTEWSCERWLLFWSTFLQLDFAQLYWLTSRSRDGWRRDTGIKLCRKERAGAVNGILLCRILKARHVTTVARNCCGPRSGDNCGSSPKSESTLAKTKSSQTDATRLLLDPPIQWIRGLITRPSNLHKTQASNE
jgi:hypothetical protein